jgi:hypothetical protein
MRVNGVHGRTPAVPLIHLRGGFPPGGDVQVNFERKRRIRPSGTPGKALDVFLVAS